MTRVQGTVWPKSTCNDGSEVPESFQDQLLRLYFILMYFNIHFSTFLGGRVNILSLFLLVIFGNMFVFVLFKM